MVELARREGAVERRPSIAVLEAVAAEEGCEPADLETPLYRAVDPEALDALVDSPMEGEVTFAYHGYELSVDGDGAVTVAAGGD